MAHRASSLAFPCRLANGLEGVRIESKGRLSTLTFFNVSEKDYGNYTCVATNKLGNTNASIILYGRCALFFLQQSSKRMSRVKMTEAKMRRRRRRKRKRWRKKRRQQPGARAVRDRASEHSLYSCGMSGAASGDIPGRGHIR